jgi:hypothetical protein
MPTEPSFLIWMARIVALLWGGWWTFFGLASGIGEKLKATGILIHATAPGLVFLVSALVAWRWPLAGGIVLLLEGVAVTIAYPLAFGSRFAVRTVLFVLATMAIPPLVAGAIFVTVRH